MIPSQTEHKWDPWVWNRNLNFAVPGTRISRVPSLVKHRFTIVSGYRWTLLASYIVLEWFVSLMYSPVTCQIVKVFEWLSLTSHMLHGYSFLPMYILPLYFWLLIVHFNDFHTKLDATQLFPIIFSIIIS